MKYKYRGKKNTPLKEEKRIIKYELKKLSVGVVKGFDRLISSLLVMLMVLSAIIVPNGSIAYAQGDEKSSNYDVVLTSITPKVDSGNTGILELDVKIAGSQESINEDLGGNAIVTVQFPDKTTYYTLNKENLDSLSILGVTPTYEDNSRILRWDLKNIETGVSAKVQIPINTNNGITPNDTVLDFSANLTKQDGTLLAGPSDANFTIQSVYNASVSKKYKGVKDSDEEAPKKDDQVIWTLKGSVTLPERKGMHIKPESEIIVQDILPQGLKYVSSKVLKGNLSEGHDVNGTITWTAQAPNIEQQKESSKDASAIYTFEIEMITEVTLDTEKLAKLNNEVSFTTTNIMDQIVTKKDSAVVTVVPDGDGVETQNGTWYPSVTGGPKKGVNQFQNVGNPNISVTDSESLTFHSVYAIALNGEDILTKEGQNVRDQWKPQDVFKMGYKKIVGKNTFSDKLIFSGVYVEVPKSYYHSTQPVTRLLKDPVTTVTVYIKDGEPKSYTVPFNKDGGIHRVMVSRSDLGLKDTDKVTSFDIEYKNADDSPIFGGVALDTLPYFSIEKGYEGVAQWQIKWEMTLQNNETYIKYADGLDHNIGPRTVTVVQQENKPAKIRTGVKFKEADGNIVKIGDNRVRHWVTPEYDSAKSLNGKVSSVILLPYGVKLKENTKFAFEHQEYRINRLAEPSTGEGKVIDDNYKGTGQQLVKLSWDKDIVYPFNQLAVEFDVEITKDATKSMDIISYTASTGEKQLIASYPDINTIDQDTDDINKDNIAADQMRMKATKTYSLRTKEDLISKKLVKGSLDSDFSRFGKTSLGGDIEYKIVLTNTTGRNISRLGFVDVLPSVGDLGIVDNTERGSAFTPLLKGPINLPSDWADKVDVYYSTSKNPKRTDLYSKVDYSDKAFKHVDPDTAEEPNWMQEVADWSTIHSFKLELKPGTIWIKGQDISLTFTMKAPEKEDTTNLPDPGILFTDINDAERTENNEQKAAWNSFAVTANGLLPTEPERVGVVLFEKGGAVRVKYFIEGTTTELDNPTAGERVATGDTDEGWYTVKNPGSELGEEYNTVTEDLQPKVLYKDGKTYVLTEKKVRNDSAPVNGDVKADTQYIIYEYKLVKGDVYVKYFIEGTDTELENPKAKDKTKEGWYTVKKDSPIDEEYKTDNEELKPKTLKDKDGKTYVLTKAETRKDSDPKDGTVKEKTQYVKYEYKETGAVRVKYFIEGTTTEL
ncbi:TPA: hypothetical protein U2D11_001979, partial [Streptococcus suis]|nr:hypothetical protein [Streptococcus suis]